MQPHPSWTLGPMCTLESEGLHEAVARVARGRPDAIALRAGNRSVTYEELDHTADAWAASLAAHDVRPRDRVPVLLPRSAELVLGLLAVLKTGAAYALLDPSWPPARVAEVLKQLDPPLLVSTAPGGGISVPVWSPPSTSLAPRHGFRPLGVKGSDPCCVFFTSGTTGIPKGVLSPHRATARLFQPDGFARFADDTVMPLAAPAPWDAFSLELWSVLLNGGTSLVIEEPYLSATTLRNGVTEHRVDTVWVTASLFNMIIDEDLDAFCGLRQVMTGGERLSVGHVTRFLERHPGITLLNGYGPVESTIFATTHRIRTSDCKRPGGIPLGRPVPGTEVLVLDDTRTCAVAETGEICIGGAGLALGYLGAPALNDEKFVCIQLGERTVRVYRTGDLGFWDAEGLLHFRGRADRQVKVHGHRVEPAEVERVLERYLRVTSCRVLARTDATGATEDLVAFCVPDRAGDALENARDKLRDEMPAYQLPAAIVSVDSLPLTPQGKLDERALLAMIEHQHDAEPVSVFTARTSDVDPTTVAVHDVFAAVLARRTVPLDVSFFDLGGTSLGAGRVCARLGARLGRPLPVSMLYEHPTVVSLAASLRTVMAAPNLVGERSPRGHVPLTSMQLVHLTRYLLDPADLTSHCLLMWRIEGPLNLGALEAAIAAVHERHESLHAAYVADPEPHAEVDDDIPAPPLEIVPAHDSFDDAVRALRNELAAELDPTSGDIWRTVVAPVGDRSQTLFGCVIHHIAFDGWSESVLANELSAAYNTAKGVAEPITHLPSSLERVYAVLTDQFARCALYEHCDNIRQELSDIPAMRWPTIPSAKRGSPPGRIEVQLSDDLVGKIDATARAFGTTRFVVLLSHYAVSLAEVTGQRAFTIGVPVAQRSDVHLEHLIGCLINMVCIPVRETSLTSGTSAIEAMSQVVKCVFATQEVPYLDVLRLIAPCETDRPPLFQTLFALQDNPTPHLRLAGLRSTFLRQPYLALPLELHTELWPSEDGGLRLEIAFRRDAVAESTAEELATSFVRLARTIGIGADV